MPIFPIVTVTNMGHFMKFSWPQRSFGPNSESVILCMMDDHSLMNDGGASKSNYECIDGKYCMVNYSMDFFCMPK